MEAHREDFEAIGINVAGMTYDSQTVLATFHAEEALGYPLLKDEAAKHVNALGVRNMRYKEGDRAYGIPHPGVLYIDSAGVVRAKYAVPGYRERPPFDALLEHLRGLVK